MVLILLAALCRQAMESYMERQIMEEAAMMMKTMNRDMVLFFPLILPLPLTKS
jgi:hypothetical protein